MSIFYVYDILNVRSVKYPTILSTLTSEPSVIPTNFRETFRQRGVDRPAGYPYEAGLTTDVTGYPL